MAAHSHSSPHGSQPVGVIDVEKKSARIRMLIVRFDMKLNHKNYFTNKNNYLTNSKIKDYLRSKEYFKAKHIDHSTTRKTSDALIEGSMLDTYLTEGADVFGTLYQVVARRNKKNPPAGYTEVTQVMWDNCVSRAEKVLRCSAFRDLSYYKTQQILQVDIDDYGNFLGHAGMLDFLDVDKKGKTASIVDLKTSMTANPTKYFWKTKEFGYDKQMAWYGMLVHECYGIEYSNIEYKHLVVEKDLDGINRVETFIFDNDLIDEKRVFLLEKAFEIAKQSDWEDEDVTWSGAHTIKKDGVIKSWDTDLSAVLPE